MIRKAVVGGLVAFLLTVFFVGRDALSYVRTSAGYVKDSAQGMVPMEFQLQRARQMIKDLAPEVQKNMHLIAKEEVELQRLESNIADQESRLTREKGQITQLRTAVVSGDSEFRFGGRKYTVEQVKLDLTNRFERYKMGESTLSNLRQMQLARQKGLDAARQKLEGTLAAKRQLQVEVENLEARNKMVAAARTTSNYQFDETQLGRVKELLADLRTRLEVDERLVNADIAYPDEIPVDKPSSDDIAKQVADYFQESPKPADNVAKK